MKLGGTDISKIYLGSTEVGSAYLGSVQVHGSSLPYDVQIEYLESTGTQYLNTGIIGNNNYKVELKVKTKQDAVMGLFGSRIYTNKLSRGFGLYTVASTNDLPTRVQFNYASSGSNINASINEDHIFTLDGNKAYIDGSSVHNFTSSTFTSPSTFIICSCHTGSSGGDVDSRFFVGLIYYCKIWNNGTLVRDYIPVRVGSTGYLYDRVSKQLFGNAGTGDFILGPDKTT